KCLEIATARSSKKCLGKRKAAALFDLEAGPGTANVFARTRSELTTGCGIAPDGRCDLVESQTEDIVEQKDGTLKRGKTFERKHQRQRNVFDLFLLHHRIGK